MTRVEMIYDRNIVLGFRMEGHAEFNPGGPDILCAALSTAAQMTINGTLDWSGLSYSHILKEEDKAKGILHVEFADRLHGTSTVQQLFRSFELYVEQLASQYKDHVSIERRYRDDM